MVPSFGLSPATTCYVILAVVLVLFIWNRLPIGIVALGAALALYATGVLNLNQALAGFGDPVVIFIASLFVVSEALDGTGVTTWAGQQLITRVGDSHTRLILQQRAPDLRLQACPGPRWCLNLHAGAGRRYSPKEPARPKYPPARSRKTLAEARPRGTKSARPLVRSSLVVS